MANLIHTINDNIIQIRSPAETAIQSLKITFSPIQEGTGNTSLTNIKPINGWTGLNIIKCGKNIFNKI